MKSNTGKTRHFKNYSEKRLPRVFTIRVIRSPSKLTTKTGFKLVLPGPKISYIKTIK